MGVSPTASQPSWGDWSFCTGSPLWAFESELGVQAQFGFWGPLVYTQGGDDEAFGQCRALEVKPERSFRLSAMGYITLELAGRPRLPHRQFGPRP